MTLPTFDPMPYPVLAQDADGVDAFQDVSTVAGRNFTRFNQFWQGRRANYELFESSRAQSNNATVCNGSSTQLEDIPVDQPAFPVLTFTIPSWTKTLWYSFFGYVSARDAGVNNYLLYSTTVAGSGLIYVPDQWSLGVYARNCLYAGSRHFVWRTGQFTPGAAVVATPKVFYANANSAAGTTYYGPGIISFMALG